MIYVRFSLLVFVSFYSCLSAGPLSPPENPSLAREQKFLGPFKIDIEEALTCGQLIEYHGFTYETHSAISEDGYKLKLYRIINQAAREAYGDKLIPVLLVHGILLDCSSWMYNSKFNPNWKKGFTYGEESDWNDDHGVLLNRSTNDLAIALATREFDVWLSNDRGTSYSREHTHLDSFNDPEFWDFSWVEMGRYDIPANVDYVRKVTKHEKILFIGYSQGTQQMLTHLAEDPSFADKLSLNILVSPIAFLGGAPGFASVAPTQRAFTHAIASYVGPLFPFQIEANTVLTLLCTVPQLNPICEEIYFQLFGPDREMFDSRHFPVLTSLLDATSFKVLVHDLQSIHFGQMRYFDYGDAKNLELYGSRLPPKINFSNVPTHNLVLVSGVRDFLASPKNVQRLRNLLKGRALVDHLITFPEWQHADIVLGTGAFQYCHLPIIKIIRENINEGLKRQFQHYHQPENESGIEIQSNE